MAKIAMTAATLSKWVAFGYVKVYAIYGFNANAADVYIQLHQNALLASGAAPANGTVPTFKSLVAQGATNSGYAAGNGFAYNLGPEGIEFTDLVVCCSSTEANLTLVGAAAALDMTLVVDSNYLCNGTEVVVGDLTTNQQTLQVWTEANGLLTRYRLLKVDIINSDTTAAHVSYCDVYATDAMAAADLKLVHSPVTVPASGTATTNIMTGIEGLSPFQQDANYTKHYGCSITVAGSTNCTIRAIYR